MYVCVFSSHLFWTSSSLDVPAGVTWRTTLFLRGMPLFFSARESDCAVRRELCFGKKTLKEPIIQTAASLSSFSLRNFFQLIPNFPFN